MLIFQSRAVRVYEISCNPTCLFFLLIFFGAQTAQKQRNLTFFSCALVSVDVTRTEDGSSSGRLCNTGKLHVNVRLFLVQSDR